MNGLVGILMWWGVSESTLFSYAILNVVVNTFFFLVADCVYV
jgi:hypothetical protein